MDPDTLRLIFREVHTIKGLARGFQLQTLANLTHIAEERLSRLKQDGQSPPQKEVEDTLRPLVELLRNYQEILVEKFGLAMDSQLQVSALPE